MTTTKGFCEASTPWQVAQGFVDGDDVGENPSEGRLAKMARAARKSLFLTQKQLAMALDMTGGAVCWWETGRSKPNGGAKVLLELIAAGDQSAIDHLNDRLRIRMKEEFDRSRVDGKAPVKRKRDRPAKKKVEVVETAEVAEAATETPLPEVEPSPAVTALYEDCAPADPTNAEVVPAENVSAEQ